MEGNGDNMDGQPITGNGTIIAENPNVITMTVGGEQDVNIDVNINVKSVDDGEEEPQSDAQADVSVNSAIEEIIEEQPIDQLIEEDPEHGEEEEVEADGEEEEEVEEVDGADKPATEEEEEEEEMEEGAEAKGSGDTKKEASLKRAAEKEPELDMEQCRCCRSPTDLVDIFQEAPQKEKEEDVIVIKPRKKRGKDRICDKIMKICSGVRIFERDHLPHLICSQCVNKLQAALDFKALCETTDQELRKALPRAKNKVRKTTDYVLIDYDPSDDDDEDRNQKDDDDFKLSNEEVEESEVDSDISFDVDKPKKRGRKPKSATTTPVAVKRKMVATPPSRGGKRGRPRNPVSAAKPDIVYISAPPDTSSSEEEEEEDEDDEPIVKRGRGRPKSTAAKPSPASAKPGPASSKHSPASAKHSPASAKPGPASKKYPCDFCKEPFPTSLALIEHQEKHSLFLNQLVCIKCHKKFATKIDVKKHQLAATCTKATNFVCPSCKRTFTGPTRLLQHLQSTCGGNAKKAAAAASPATKLSAAAKTPGKASKFVATPKKVASGGGTSDDPAPVSGKNLFKCVAPMTTTYWSDSFSD